MNVKKKKYIQRQALLHANEAFLNTKLKNAHTQNVSLDAPGSGIVIYEFTYICHRPRNDFLRLILLFRVQVHTLLRNTEHFNHWIPSPTHILKSALGDAGIEVNLFQTVELLPALSMSILNNNILKSFIKDQQTWVNQRHVQQHKLQQQEPILSILEDIPMGQPKDSLHWQIGPGQARHLLTMGNQGPCGAAAFCFLMA